MAVDGDWILGNVSIYLRGLTHGLLMEYRV